MSQSERDFMDHIDSIILGASPAALSKLAELDKKTQLGGKSFYDVYFTLSDEERKQIMLLCQSKKGNRPF
jgi:hypothetical protein